MSALDDLLKSVESDLHLVQRDLLGRTGPIRAALETYERAVQEEAALAYCRDHSLKKPQVVGLSKADAAKRLLELVRQLPELGAAKSESNSEAAPKSAPALEPEPPQEDEVTKLFRERFPKLTQASKHGKLLVLGAFSGRTKTLPGPLGEVTEWIDTATDGNRLVTHAVKRVRAGHVFAVIICDQAIGHQHAEPMTDAARRQKIPIGYAGKGGNASIARALESLEQSLT